ncbi:hypothetical protein D3C76_1342080 [compost metagenome]
MQHIRGDFGHARHSGRIHQFAFGLHQLTGALLHALFEAFIGRLQCLVDLIDRGVTANQPHRQVDHQQRHQAGTHGQVDMVLTVGCGGPALCLVQQLIDAVQLLGNRNDADAIKQVIDDRLFLDNGLDVLDQGHEGGLIGRGQLVDVGFQLS